MHRVFHPLNEAWESCRMIYIDLGKLKILCIFSNIVLGLFYAFLKVNYLWVFYPICVSEV